MVCVKGCLVWEDAANRARWAPKPRRDNMVEIFGYLQVYISVKEECVYLNRIACKDMELGLPASDAA